MCIVIYSETVIMLFLDTKKLGVIFDEYYTQSMELSCAENTWDQSQKNIVTIET